MKSKIIIVIISLILIISSTGYTQNGQSLNDVYTRLGNMENRVNTVDVKVDRNSDLIKMGFDNNVVDHNGIVGRLNGISARIGSIDTNSINTTNSLSTINNKLSSNLLDYTAAANKLDSNNKLNDVLLRGEAIQTPAKTNYIGYLIVGCLSGILSGGIIILVERISRPNHNVEHN